MRYISIDLSSDNHLQQPIIFAGYEGEHNESILQVKLPKRMVDIECSGYRFDFQTSEDNKISSPLIPVSELINDILSFHLTEQFTIVGNLLLNVAAIQSDENTVSLISKTNTAILHIKDSPKGNVQLIDPNGYKDELLKMVDERILEINPENVDQTFNPTSKNSQSGKAVNEALNNQWTNKVYALTNKYYFEGKETTIPLSDRGINLGDNIKNAYQLHMEITKEQLAKIDELRLVRFKDWSTSKINLTDNLLYSDPNGIGNVYNIPNAGFVIVGFKDGVLNISTDMNIPVPYAGVFVVIPDEKYNDLENNYVLISKTGEFTADKYLNVKSKNLDIPDISNLALDTERFCVFTTDAPLKDIPYGTSQWLYYYQVKYGCGYGSDTYKNQYGQIKEIPKIGDMLICTQNGYIYKVAGLDEAEQKLAVWYMSGVTVDQVFDSESENSQSGIAVSQAIDDALASLIGVGTDIYEATADNLFFVVVD